MDTAGATFPTGNLNRPVCTGCLGRKSTTIAQTARTARATSHFRERFMSCPSHHTAAPPQMKANSTSIRTHVSSDDKDEDKRQRTFTKLD